MYFYKYVYRQGAVSTWFMPPQMVFLQAETLSPNIHEKLNENTHGKAEKMYC